TGRRDSAGSGLPSGRPRWDMTTIRARRRRRLSRVGSAARRRVSSAILPSFRGTLKSSRTRTLLPATSTSSKDAFTLDVCLKPLGHVGDQVDHPAAEPPLVVVPADDLGCALTERDGQRRIDYRRGGVGLEV